MPVLLDKTAQLAIVSGVISLGYKKGEGALPRLCFLLERPSDLPLVYTDHLVYRFHPPVVAGVGWNRAIHSSLIFEIFFAVVEITLHAAGQLAGEAALDAAVAESSGDACTGFAVFGIGRAGPQFNNFCSALLSSAPDVFPAIHFGHPFSKIWRHCATLPHFRIVPGGSILCSHKGQAVKPDVLNIR